MPSLTDVAREAGVSLTTASMVLNKGKQHNRVSASCAQRVQEAAARLGYVPNYHARSMKLGRAEVIAVALDMDVSPSADRPSPELSDPYLSRLIGGIQARIRALGYMMTLVGPDTSSCAPDRALVGLKQRRFDGIIVPALSVRNSQSMLLEKPADCPVVIIESNAPTPHPHVTFDEAAGIEAALTHLTSLGHRNVLYVTESNRGSQNFSRACQRMEISHDTWELALPSTRETLHPDRQISAVAEAFATRWSTAGTHHTAILASSDVLAVGIIDALTAAGLRVPKDISVVGFDDTIAPYATPRLTTISHELGEMGRCAVDLCMQMVNDPTQIVALQGTTSTVKPRLVERASTGPAAHSSSRLTPA